MFLSKIPVMKTQKQNNVKYIAFFGFCDRYPFAYNKHIALIIESDNNRV